MNIDEEKVVGDDDRKEIMDEGEQLGDVFGEDKDIDMKDINNNEENENDRGILIIKSKIINLLNQAKILGQGNAENVQKQEILSQIFELMFHQEPSLLPSFFPELLLFELDQSMIVRKYVVYTIEIICKEFPSYIQIAQGTLSRLLGDRASTVTQKVVQAVTNMWPILLKKIYENYDSTVSEAVDIWNSLNNLKDEIIKLLKSQNDGICTQVIKFFEAIIMGYTYSSVVSEDESSSKKQSPRNIPKRFLFSADDIPENFHLLLSIESMNIEVQKILDQLISFSQDSPSSTNLMIVVSVLSSLAQWREPLLSKVLPPLFEIQKHPPPLSTSQIHSVRYSLKNAFLSIIKCPFPELKQYVDPLVECLGDLGAIDVAHDAIRRNSVLQKRRRRTEDSREHPKKKLKSDHSTKLVVPLDDTFSLERIPSWIKEINLDTVVPLILESIKAFDVSILSSLPSDTGNFVVVLEKALKFFMPSTFLHDKAKIKPSFLQARQLPSFPEAPSLPVVQPELSQIKIIQNRIFFNAIKAETFSLSDWEFKSSIIARLVSRTELSESAIDSLISSIFIDFGSRQLIALQWLYQEAFSSINYPKEIQNPMERYEKALNSLLVKLISNLDSKDYHIFTFITRLPFITDRVVTFISDCYENHDRINAGLKILENLMLNRISCRNLCLNLLFRLAYHEDKNVQSSVINFLADMYQKDFLASEIEGYANMFIVDSSPPLEDEKGDMKHRFPLFFALCSKNPTLIHRLASFYGFTDASSRKLIHRELGTLVEKIGINCAELHQLIQNHSPHSQSFVLHVLNIMTEKTNPSPTLVKIVKNVYRKVHDVRYLTFIVSELSKDEIIEVLPQIVALPMTIVKPFIIRTINILQNPPLSPSELLVQLHLIEASDGVSLKQITQATQICFDQPNIYKQETLAVVLQQLQDVSPLPALFMRSVILSVNRYPRMTDYIMSLLNRLIPKHIWQDLRLWEGFVRCCKITQPYSYSVLLQLPAPQLSDVLKRLPEIRPLLQKHTLSQAKGKVSSSLMELIMGDGIEKTEKEETIQLQPDDDSNVDATPI